MDGTVQDKQITHGMFNNTTYTLVLKIEKDQEKQKKKRIKAEIFDMIKAGDKIVKDSFSFTYRINDREYNPLTPTRFISHTALIYLTISGGLLFLEFARN